MIHKLRMERIFIRSISLCFQKSNVLVCGGSADVADPCQFRHIQLLTLVGGIVAKESGGDVLFAHLRPPDLPPLGSGIFHARPHSCSYHRQFQLTEHTRHLEKCFAHGVGLSVPAIQSDGANDDQPQVLLPHNLNDFTELLCASGKAGHFQHNDGVARLGFRKHRLLLALDLGIAVFILHENLLGSRLFQFPHLAVDVLSGFVGGTATVSVIHDYLSF